MMNRLFFTVAAAVTISACATTSVGQRATASTVKIAIEVEQDTLLVRSFKDDVAGNLSQFVLESKNGVPVVDTSNADLKLHLTIQDVNFTHATKWKWELIDVQNQAIIASKTDTSAMGQDPSSVAADIVNALSQLDLQPYASSNNGVMPAQPIAVQSQPAHSIPTSTTDGSNSWAVVIGVENYRENLAPASGAQSDADAFAEFAQTTLNIPEANIRVLKNERASRADMSAALNEWLPRNAVKPGGKVYVFFSGHGAPDIEEGSAYLMPYDANPTYIKSGGMRVADLQDRLGKLNQQTVYLFLDACFSGSGERSVLAQGTRPMVPVKEIKTSVGVVTVSASAASETTGAHAQSGHGLFTYHLLNGLTGAADANSNSNITVSELKKYLVESVQTDARRDNREQTPTVAMPSGFDQNTDLVSGVQ